MPEPTDITVAVSLDGVQKRLFSIRERKNGDLIIPIHHGLQTRPIGEWKSADQPQIQNQHYSVHRSLQSPDRINLIKHTLKLSDGTEQTSTIYTRAMKQTSRHAIMFACRSPDLRSDHFDYTGKHGVILAPFNPGTSTLFYMLVACDVDHPCTFTGAPDFDFRVIPYTHFKVVVLWSFALLPAHPSGTKIHSMTVDGMDALFEENIPMDGYEEEMLVDLFRFNREQLREEVIHVITNQIPSLSEQLALVRKLPFMSSSPAMSG